MRNALIADQLDPLIELNTTPLIDVMLVLLVMFIITIPIANPRREARFAGALPRMSGASRRR